MNEKKIDLITPDDFNSICRVCLKFEEDMMSIFGSGINEQIMEIINVEIKEDDQLPKTLCQNCKLQLHRTSEFIQKAKSSEFFLKSLLSSINECAEEELEPKKIKTFKMKKSKRKIENVVDSESISLILVNKPDDSKPEGQIHIKELNLAYDNLGLAHHCKAIMESHSFDHCSSKDLKQEEMLALNLLQLKNKKIVAINLEIFKCTECDRKFEKNEEFTCHLLTHGIDKSVVQNKYSCPVCIFSENERYKFFSHLKTHTDYIFVKTNSKGEEGPLQEDEECVFKIPKPSLDCPVFCINLNNARCMKCLSIQSKNIIAEHLRLCLPNDKPEFKIKYKCPVCEKSFINEDVKFIHHLGSHEKGNFFFIKANSTLPPIIPIKDINEETIYVFGENLASMIFEVVESNSCHRCNYVSECFSELSYHCDVIHSEKVSFWEFRCPVCGEHFQNEKVDDSRVLFYEHLKVHKNEVSFILITKNGALADLKPEHSGVFTQSFVLWNLINSTAVQNYIPDIVASSYKTTSNCMCELYQKKKKSKGKNYISEISGREIAGKVGYARHTKHSRRFFGGKKPVCSLCNKTFANRTTLNAHLKQHVKEGVENEFQMTLLNLICDKCGQSFSNNRNLIKHQKVHLMSKENAALKCDICGRVFFKQTALDKHKSAHLNPKYFECSDCKLPLPSITGLQKHSEIHKNGCKTFDCKACELSFLTKDSLTAHQTHTGHYLGREPLECNVCHEKFFIGRKFAEHIKTHPKYKMGECTLCGKRLSTIQSLMIHMGRHFETNRILCPHCGKKFFEEKNYHRHLLTHEGVKPFACNVESCKKSFYTLFELKRHKKYHSNTRDFKCSYCCKSFHEANHLTVHIRTHTGERPYGCPHCNKSFVTRTRCKQHIKLIHQGIGYDLIKTTISKKVTVFETVGIDL